MAIIYQNPLRGVNNPEQIEQRIAVAKDPENHYRVRYDAISYLRGCAKFYQRDDSKRAAVVYLRQQITELSALIHDSKEGQDVDTTSP